MEAEAPICVEQSPREGRLLFDTLSTSPKDVTVNTRTQPQPQPLVLVLQTTPPNQHSLLCETTPPNNTNTQPNFLVITSPTTQTANPVVTTPTLSQSHPPKPKLTKEEREALRWKREREREELKMRRDEEKFLRQQEKMRKEQEKRERQLKKEQEAKERQQRKAWEVKMKERKREQKEAEKRKLEEDRKKAEQEKERLKDEKLRKAQQNKERLMGFFLRKPKEETVKPAKQEYSFITPFSLKASMTLATRPRAPLQNTAEFDHLFQAQDSSVSMESCVKELREVSPGKWSHSNSQVADDVIEIRPDTTRIEHQFKLLQFHENHRPAYYGTWRKNSCHINPRNPFKRDEGLLDYSVDSDEEWEEEDPGESISNSEGEESGEDQEDDEEDDGFFVPHGYLSDGEGDDELPAGFDPNGNTEDSESKRRKMADKAKAWETEFARKCQPLKPIKIGCTWTPLTVDGDNLSKDESFLQQFAAVALVDLPLSLETKKEKEQKDGSSEQTRMPVPKEAVPDLIRLMHKSSIGVARIIKTFRVHWGAKRLQSSRATPTNGEAGSEDLLSPPRTPSASPPDSSSLEQASGISKRQIEKKIHEIAVKESRPLSSRPQWYVHDAVLAKYSLDPDNLSPLIPLSSPQNKLNSDLSKCPAAATQPLHCALHESSVKKRKTDGLLMNMFVRVKKSPNAESDSPPQPKRVKLELHVDKPTPPDCESIRQSSQRDSATPLSLGKEVRREKRDLEEPVPPSAAKRLCLEDTTNKAARNETGVGEDDSLKDEPMNIKSQLDSSNVIVL